VLEKPLERNIFQKSLSLFLLCCEIPFVISKTKMEKDPIKEVSFTGRSQTLLST
jgi:hypothetical protein